MANAISAIVIVGADAGGADRNHAGKTAGRAGAVALAAVNMFGGFPGDAPDAGDVQEEDRPAGPAK